MTATTATSLGCTHLPPEAGERFQIFDDEVVIKVAGDETENSYALLTLTIAPGGGPPLHAHPGSETLFVLTGEFAFTVREDSGVASFRGGPGTLVHAPAGAPHRFENVGASPAALLIVGAPETVDFLREAGATFPPGAEPDMERMLELSAKYNVETIYGGEGARPEPAKEGATSERARALAWRFE